MAWILTDECDSLLFSCLDAVGRDKPFDICQARVGKGLWLRRPACCGECSSTTSRDMQMGLLVYLFHFKRADLLKELIDRCLHSWGKMGTENKPAEPVTIPWISQKLGWYPKIRNNRVYYTPGLLLLLLACYLHVRGHKKAAALLSRFPQAYTTAPGYVSHLTLLHLYLNARIRGHLTPKEHRLLGAIQNHMDSNPLVAALQGNGPKALALLEKHWPGGLPAPKTSWSEPWRLQRSDGDPGLEPDSSADPLVYHGDGDYLFARHAIALFC